METSSVILLVDDSQIQRKIYANLLKSSGYSVVLGEDGRQGVELALQHHPDLILMDISMPEMDGLDATRELRGYPEMETVPILALTATTDPDELEQARLAGYTDSVNKNGDRIQFLEKVRQW